MCIRDSTRGEELQFPLKTLTLSEEFRVDLSWDPKEIKPNVPVKFIYTFRNPVDQGPIRDSDYTFTLLQNGQEIFSRSANAKIGADYSEYTFSEEQTGLTVARFSNISGSGQETEFAFVIGDKKPASSIPAWIKNNAGWWADGQIPDSAFVQGIQFLIKEGVMIIPETETSESSDSQGIPDWIKNNAGWWADGQINDDTFVQGIQFLIKAGIIVINDN